MKDNRNILLQKFHCYSSLFSFFKLFSFLMLLLKMKFRMFFHFNYCFNSREAAVDTEQCALCYGVPRASAKLVPASLRLLFRQYYYFVVGTRYHFAVSVFPYAFDNAISFSWDSFWCTKKKLHFDCVEFS